MIDATFRRSCLAAACSAAMLMGTAGAASAAVVVDFNDFTPGSPNGQHAGTGFDAEEAWGGSGRVFVVDGDLNSTNYTLTQSSPAQSLQGDFNAPRHTGRSFDTAMTGEVWFSYLVNLPADSARAGLAFNTTSTNGTDYHYSVYLLGTETLRVGPGRQSSNNVDASINAGVGETFLIVGRIDTDLDKITVWFNPDLVADPNILNRTADIDANLLADYGLDSVHKVSVMSWGAGGVGGIIDNVRVSTNYTDVTGGVIPEPASLALVGMGSLLMLRRRR